MLISHFCSSKRYQWPPDICSPWIPYPPDTLHPRLRYLPDTLSPGYPTPKEDMGPEIPYPPPPVPPRSMTQRHPTPRKDMVTSPPGFKVRMGSLIHTWWRHMCYMFPESHIWCNTCQPLPFSSTYLQYQ